MVGSGCTDRLFVAVVDRWLGVGPATTPDVVVTRDIAVPVPGHDAAPATTLATDHYRPRDVHRGPVVLVRTAYGKETWLGRLFGTLLSRRGLQVVVQEVRGTFGSPGEFEPFRHEHQDGLATVRWIREQPWCDGRVATAGMSYLGYTQWAIAPYAEPRLAAMALGVTASDIRALFYPGDSVGFQMALSWSSGIGTQEDRGSLLRTVGLRRRVTQAMTTLPPRRADVAAIGRHVQFLSDVLDHAEPDDQYWDALDHSRRLDTLGTPASLVAGWYDIFLIPQLRDFAALQSAGVPSRLTVGPWGHGSLTSIRPEFADQIEWLTAHLRDDAEPARRAAVRIYLQKANRWLDFDQWPVPAQPRRLFLTVGGQLDDRPPRRAGVRAFRYDPADPTPIVGGAWLGMPSGQRDNRRIEARDDVLCYQTAPLDHDLDVIGEISAEIHVRTQYPDADVVVRICDVEPNGRSLNVTEGVRRLRRTDVPLDHTSSARVATVELRPTAYRFRRGHRIRVQICGGAFPVYLRNHQTGDPVADGVRLRPGQTQVLHDPDRPSTIRLPVHGPGEHRRPRGHEPTDTPQTTGNG